MFVLICYEPLQLDGQRLLVDLNSWQLHSGHTMWDRKPVSLVVGFGFLVGVC